jgi:hypothetical protein
MFSLYSDDEQYWTQSSLLSFISSDSSCIRISSGYSDSSDFGFVARFIGYILGC